MARHRKRWVRTQFSSALSGRRSKATGPEIILRRALHSRGLRYRTNRLVLGIAAVDIAFVAAKVAVFVDGCFWHGCPKHRWKKFAGPNASLWRSKIDRTRKRDREQSRALSKAGWRVLRFWECDLRFGSCLAAKRVERGVMVRLSALSRSQRVGAGVKRNREWRRKPRSSAGMLVKGKC